MEKSPTLRAGPVPAIVKVQIGKTLDTTDQNPSKNQGEIAIVQAYDIGEARRRNPKEYTEVSPTIMAACGTGGNNVPAVVYGANCFTGDGRDNGDMTATIVGDHENRITDMTNIICMTTDQKIINVTGMVGRLPEHLPQGMRGGHPFSYRTEKSGERKV